MNTFKKLALTLALIVALGLIATGLLVQAAPPAQTPTTFSSVRINGTLDMTNGAISNIGVAGTDFSATGGLTLADALTVSSGGVTLSDGDLVVADDLRVTAQTSITVTDATTFTVTGSYQPITAASEVTPTIAAGTEGDMVVIVSLSTGPVNIADSGSVALAGAVALGQYDSITLIYDDTAAAWVELSRSNN